VDLVAGQPVRLSAGLLLHRPGPGGSGDPEVLLGHMGGPYWARKDDGAWSIPKGEHDADEEPRAAAAREFTEELGSPPPPGPLLELGTVRQGSGKRITAFALAADFDADHITPGTFELEWPPRSGRVRTFPEVDRAAWFDPETARRKLVRAQVAFLDRLLGSLSRAGSAPDGPGTSSG
jgi:predicted NUDIX family NTP pyrophosphohydrolase